MAKEYDNELSGVLFKNDMEGKSENFPPYGGSCQIDGKEYWQSAWVKEGKNGKFFSFSYKLKDKQTVSKPSSNQTEVPGFEEDSDIPF